MTRSNDRLLLFKIDRTTNKETMKTQICKKNFRTALLFFLLHMAGYAQGPNAPEAGSFEPVDATDMVNLVTGDFTYVLPLLNVPSPEGGYPIALSYHAGIAMDQEASWVGLGWNVNPGAINRGVNGYPDDLDDMTINEFLYDKGLTLDYYSVGVGATFSGSVSVALGASWGSNRSLGGFVAVSAGIGGTTNTGSAGVQLSTNGISLHGSFMGFSANIGSNGVGIGYQMSGTSSGFNVNYNLNSGQLLGRANLGDDLGNSMGISLSSKGISISGFISSVGTGINVGSSTGNFIKGSYKIQESSTDFYLPMSCFFISYNYKRVTFSLFEERSSKVSGIGYPYAPHKALSYGFLQSQVSNNSMMDINKVSMVRDYMPFNDLLDLDMQIGVNNLVLPNYDNYMLTAQGLTGYIIPGVYRDLNLSGKGSNLPISHSGNEYFKEGETYEFYLNKNFSEDYNYNYQGEAYSYTSEPFNFRNNLFFYFKNEYGSFFRNNKSNIYKLPEYINDEHSPGADALAFDRYTKHIISKYYGTENSNIYSIDITPDGNLLENNLRKRTGNIIQIYTNKQIRDSYNAGDEKSSLPDFIDAEENNVITTDIEMLKFLDRSDLKKFTDSGIGAYKITTVDGKNYHYSLPVYNFETYYKTFNEKQDENQNFYEKSQTTPYATHWLLTGITGPDYVDINNNGKLDKNDYGYWIKFDYGKWSDGYVWETPMEEVSDVFINEKKTYSYSWGRKQLYYLDAIITRTHTALFIKDFRLDGKGIEKQDYNLKWDKNSESSFDFDENPISISDQISWDGAFYIYKPNPGIGWNSVGNYDLLKNIYAENGESIEINEKYNGDTVNFILGIKRIGKYFQAPSEQVLSLSKIILLKNSEFENINKSSDIQFEGDNTGFFNSFIGFHQLRVVGNYVDIFINEGDDYMPPKIYKQKPYNALFNVHQHQNILDVNDVLYLNLIEKSQKVIEFIHDYSLAKESPNSDSPNNSKLTLRKVRFMGKKGIGVVPPYQFLYSNNTNYNKDHEDGWGYNSYYPESWSLNQIVNPTGTKIDISYESDDYHKQAVPSNTLIYRKGLQFVFSEHDGNLRITVENESDVSHPLDFTKYFQQGSSTSADIWVCLRHDFWQWGCKGRTGKIDIKRNDIDVVSVTSNQLILETDLSVTSSDNGGLGMLYGKVIGEKIHPGILVNKERGQCAEPPGCINVSKRLVFQYSLNSNKILYDQDGGGIRVKQLKVSDENTSNYVRYYYNEPGFDKDKYADNYRSSGITSYTPSRTLRGIPYMSLLPTPSVLYSNVFIENYDKNHLFLGRTKYEFETLNSYKLSGNNFSLGDVFKVTENQNHFFEQDKVQANKFKVSNKFSNIGRLLSIKNYNSKGHLVSSKQNKYKRDLDNDGEIGVTEETHKTIKTKVILNEEESFNVSSTSIVNYPSVLQSTTTTVGGHTKTQYFDKYDFLTGQVLETRIDASDGTKIKTQKIPAHTIAAYSNDEDGFGMGSKADNPTHKNMLSQQAATYAYLFDEETQQWDVLNVDVTTWNNQWDYTGEVASSDEDSPHNIWRKHQTYVWEGTLNENGTYKDFDVENDAAFQWGVGASQTNPVWKKTSETTLYNHYSVPLEVQDVNGNKAANKMGDGDSKVIASANAPYADFFYSGGEYVVKDAEGNPTDYFDGDVGIADGIRFNYYGAKHTGNLPVTLYPNKKTFVVKPGTSGNYKASVWAYHRPDAVTFPTEYAHITLRVGDDDINFNASEVVRAGDWVLLCFEAAITAGQEVSIVANGNSYATLDDFRLHPVAASMTSYVYNQWDELTHIIGPNGLATEYVYDGAGNLTEVKKEVIANEEEGFEGGFKTVSKHTINYKK